MNLKRISIILLSALLAFTFIAEAAVVDLPKKRVKGQEYYYHKVKKGESLYGISKNLDMTIEDIVRYNPMASDGVKKGDLLLFPVEEFSDVVTDDESKAIVDSTEVIEDTIVVETTKAASIAVLLPFGLDKEEPTRINRLALDFYKGMLIAADSMAANVSNIEIIARDINDATPAQVSEMITSDSLLATASVIIGPEDEAILGAIATSAKNNGTYVLNMLSVRDSSYTSNPYILQGNAPQRIMYRQAVDGLISEYPGYTPVILRNITGRNEKESFTSYLTNRYRETGVEPIILEYENNLLTTQLDPLPVDSGQKYVFVPSSGSLAEFNRYAFVIKSYRDKLATIASEALDNAEITGEPAVYSVAEIFGYPDWTAFRADALDTLHRLNATIYSRFFNGYSSNIINEAFRRWYGTPIIDSVPSYGLLGFDSAMYLIENIRINNGIFDPRFPRTFSGVQTSYDFSRDGEGYVNGSIYIINYQTGGHVSARVQ